MATPQEQSHLEQAGNHGDVLKHIVLMAAIKAQQKAHPEGIIFVDTHCGPGVYNLGEQVRKACQIAACLCTVTVTLIHVLPVSCSVRRLKKPKRGS